VELAEIRSAFRQRIKLHADPKALRRVPPKRAPTRPVLTLDPEHEDARVLTPGEVAELFDVAPRTVRRRADAGVLPSFRTLGGQRGFRWGELRGSRRTSSSAALSWSSSSRAFSDQGPSARFGHGGRPAPRGAGRGPWRRPVARLKYIDKRGVLSLLSDRAALLRA